MNIENQQVKGVTYREMQVELSSDLYKVYEHLKAAWKEKLELEGQIAAEGYGVLEQPPMLPDWLRQGLASDAAGVPAKEDLKRLLKAARATNQLRDRLEKEAGFDIPSDTSPAGWARVIISALYSGLLTKETEVFCEALIMLVDLERVLQALETKKNGEKLPPFEPWNMKEQ